ncbi:hypothetical protein BDR26DRAFT_931888 [Obelidium mucronatum]|nr:hypothetical protein BDR26DRAFT_931888 [Obelidium mucronatum]
MQTQPRRPPPSLPARSETSSNSSSSSAEVVREEVFENQRGCFLFEQRRFSAKKLLPTDLPAWSTAGGAASMDRMSFPVAAGWEWISDWAVDLARDVDADGWAYAVSFRAREWLGAPAAALYVARRAWVRLRRKTPPHQAHAAAAAAHAAAAADAVLLLAPRVRSCTLDRQKVDAVAAAAALLPPGARVPPYAVAAVLAELQYDKSRLQAVKLLLPFLDTEGAASAVFLITHHCNRLELLNVMGKDSFLNAFLTIQ